MGIGIARGQYYWVLDIGCLSWYRSNPNNNDDHYLLSLLIQWTQDNCLDQRTDLTLEGRCNANKALHTLSVHYVKDLLM